MKCVDHVCNYKSDYLRGHWSFNMDSNSYAFFPVLLWKGIPIHAIGEMTKNNRAYKDTLKKELAWLWAAVGISSTSTIATSISQHLHHCLSLIADDELKSFQRLEHHLQENKTKLLEEGDEKNIVTFSRSRAPSSHVLRGESPFHRCVVPPD